MPHKQGKLLGQETIVNDRFPSWDLSTLVMIKQKLNNMKLNNMKLNHVNFLWIIPHKPISNSILNTPHNRLSKISKISKLSKLVTINKNNIIQLITKSRKIIMKRVVKDMLPLKDITPVNKDMPRDRQDTVLLNSAKISSHTLEIKT